jgi:POT family proton-dependent oligopeptide transporter
MTCTYLVLLERKRYERCRGQVPRAISERCLTFRTGLAYNQMTNNLVSQANTMNLGKTPNDIVAKLNPIFIIIVIPIMDFGVYPALRKMGVNFTPIKKITAGFALSSFAMVSACVIQW